MASIDPAIISSIISITADISANSDAISTNMESISANSDGISANSAAISTNMKSASGQRRLLRDTSDISEIDHEVVEITNKLRTDPKSYIPELQVMIGQFDGLILRRPGKPDKTTKEGAAAVQEAMNYLNTVEPVSPLTIGKAAKAYTDDMGPKGLVGNESSDGASAG